MGVQALRGSLESLEEGWEAWSEVANAPVSHTPLRLAHTVVNTDMDVREVEPSGH